MFLRFASGRHEAALQLLPFLLVLECLGSEDVQNISVEVDLGLCHPSGFALDSSHLACSENLGGLRKMDFVLEDELF